MSFFDEERLSLAQAARREGVHPGTMFRWITKGIRGGLKLESFNRGGRRFTTLEALARFYARLSSQKGDQPEPGNQAVSDGDRDYCEQHGL